MKKNIIFPIGKIWRYSKYLYLCIAKEKAQMAKLVDALVSGTSVLTDVQVRVLFWAHRNIVS